MSVYDCVLVSIAEQKNLLKENIKSSTKGLIHTDYVKSALSCWLLPTTPKPDFPYYWEKLGVSASFSEIHSATGDKKHNSTAWKKDLITMNYVFALHITFARYIIQQESFRNSESVITLCLAPSRQQPRSLSSISLKTSLLSCSSTHTLFTSLCISLGFFHLKF